MIFDVGQTMADKERGRLFSIQRDGSNSLPFIIKKDKLLIGRADSCEIRIYVFGVAPEHCIITFNDEGRGFVEPVDKWGLLYLNGALIERQVSLEHNDVITVVKRSFRFFYPSASKFIDSSTSVPASEENMVQEFADFDPEEAFTQKGKEILEKRVTFGPRLSPEEFDKSMPPASPLRKGSLPGDKLKRKISSDAVKSHLRRNLFKNKQSRRSEQFSAENQMPESTVVLQKLKSRSSGDNINIAYEKKEDAQSRPLFSDILKKPVLLKDPTENIIVGKTSRKYSPKKLAKKTIKLKDSKKSFYKSPKRIVNPRLLAVSSTGHANSPETIIISKKRLSRNSGGIFLSSTTKRKSLRSLRDSIKASTSECSESESSTVSSKNDSSSHSQHDALKKSPDSSNNFPITFNEESENTSESEIHDRPSTSKRKLRKSGGNGSTKKKCQDSAFIENKSDNALTKEKAENVVSAKNKNENDTPTKKKNDNEITEKENEMTAREQNENAKHFSSSPLAAAMDVSHIDEHSIDRSLKEIHNAVLALSYPSNVSSSLSNESSSTDMCMNAVKKLALTISMVNAFHMYNRIIDDVATFPLCFPSTSYDSSKSSMKSFQKQIAHQNEENSDFARMAWFQDIMRNFFSNSVCNEFDGGRRTIRLNENESSSNNSSPSICGRKSKRAKYSSKGKERFRAIDSGCKTSDPKSGCSHGNAVGINDESRSTQVDNLNQSSSCHDSGASIKPSYPENSPVTGLTNKEINSSEGNSRHSTSSSGEHDLHHSSQNIESPTPSTYQEVQTRQSRSSRKSSTSSSSVEKSFDNIQERLRMCNSLLSEKSPTALKSNKIFNDTPKSLRKINAPGVFSKILRSGKPLKMKRKKVSLVAKKLGISASKKLKAEKKQQKHRNRVLKKIDYRITFCKNPSVDGQNISTKVILKKKRGKGAFHKEKQNTTSLILEKNSRKSSSPSKNLYNKSRISPKLLRKRIEKRKSVLLKSKILRNRKSEVSTKNLNQRKNSVKKRPSKKDLLVLEKKDTAEKETANQLQEVTNDNADKRKILRSRATDLKKEKSIRTRTSKNLKSKMTPKSADLSVGNLASPEMSKTEHKYGRKVSPSNSAKKTSTKVIERKSIILKVKTRRGRKEVQEKSTLSDLSHTESLSSVTALEANSNQIVKEIVHKRFRAASKSLENKNCVIRVTKGRKKTKAAKKSKEVLENEVLTNKENSVLQKESEMVSSPKLQENLKVTAKRGRKKVKPASDSTEAASLPELQESKDFEVKTKRSRKKVLTNKENSVLQKEPEMVSARKGQLQENLEVRAKRGRKKVKPASDSTETASFPELQESKDFEVKTKRSRKKVKPNIANDSEEHPLKDDCGNFQNTGRRRGTRHNKNAAIETITLDENTQVKENVDSANLQQVKRGRKRDLVTVENIFSKEESKEETGIKRRKAKKNLSSSIKWTDELQEGIFTEEVEITDVISANEKRGKRKTNKTTPVKDKVKKSSKKKNELKVSPIQRVTRSLRSRK